VHVLPKLPRDTTDRNRTSPFAFTGNKFEFRMLGANVSISSPNVMLNTAVAESLRQYADALEGAKDFEGALHELIKNVILRHKRIIFNGNGYGREWEEEAERRELLNLRSTPDCAPCYLSEKNVALFARHKVYTRTELHARYEVKLDKYCKVLNIEALTMLDMLWKDILPAVSAFTGELSESAGRKRELCGELDISYETELAKTMSSLISEAVRQARALEAAIAEDKLPSDSLENAIYHRDIILPTMNALRAAVDEMELRCDAKRWPYPGYGELLFSI